MACCVQYSSGHRAGCVNISSPDSALFPQKKREMHQRRRTSACRRPFSLSWLCLLAVGAVRAFRAGMPSAGTGRPALGLRPRALTTRHGRVVSTPLCRCAAAAAAVSAPQTVRLPTGVDMQFQTAGALDVLDRPPVVFIHGSFHGGWCWAESWMSLFAEGGFPCFAVSLRGTSATPQVGGAPSVQLQEHVDDIASFVAQAIPSSRPPILVGHSFGGMYAQKLCEADRMKVAGLVLLCSVSPRGSTGTVMRYLFQKPKLAWEIVRAFVFKEAASDLDVCRRVFFSETQPADETVRRYMGYFAADCKVGLDTRTAPQQFPGKTSAGSDGRCLWLERLPPTLVRLRVGLVLSIVSAGLLRYCARILTLLRAPCLLASQVVGADRDLVVDKKAVEETAAFYDSELLWVKGPHDIMLDPVGLAPVRALSLPCMLPACSSRDTGRN